jgi:hypothetical protein
MRRVITTRGGRKAHIADDCVASKQWVTLCGRWVPNPVFLAGDHRLDLCAKCQNVKARADYAAGDCEPLAGWRTRSPERRQHDETG